jgi:proteasome accessory factor C
VTDAATKRERLSIHYWSPAADRRTEREITPRRVFVDGGAWYVIADDHLSGESRTFRIDRIEQLAATGVIDAPRDVAVPADGTWFADADLPTARLRVPASETWVAERYPTRSVTAIKNGWELVVSIASEHWLEQLLLRLGAEAKVVEPAEWKDLGARAARTLLANYGAGTHAGS